MKMMTKAYCPKNRIQKLESDCELDLESIRICGFYNTRFQELALLCLRLVSEEEDKVERPGEKKEYAGTLPLCNKCKFHHTKPCTAKWGTSKRVGHRTKDCRSPAATTNQRGPVANQRTMATCYECGEQGPYRVIAQS
ncbi:hypothetical protein Tco_0374115 [Tanacetum coccineum]